MVEPPPSLKKKMQTEGRRRRPRPPHHWVVEVGLLLVPRLHCCLFFSSFTLADLFLFTDGFNWADNMRSRAERGSIAGISASPPSAGYHTRAKSIAVMDHPVRDNPKPVNVPDQFQERILKGDFYMD